MNIILVSECTKKALIETRRILDQFAERTGQRTWQTAITMEGVKTIHYLLRKTARRNTAVACFWVRGKNRTELMWTVGKRAVFDENGRVPTNRSERNIDPGAELVWKDGRTIEVVTAMSALFHDLGKLTVGFQKKLRPGGENVDPYRHEWISLLLFSLIIRGCETDEAVLERLSTFTFDHEWYQGLQDIDFDRAIMTTPLTRLIAWLIVSHHRLPFIERKAEFSGKYYSINDFFENLSAVPGWVRNSKVELTDDFKLIMDDLAEIHPDIAKEFEGWSYALRYRAQEALNLKLYDRGEDLLSPFITYLCRTALIMGDHTYSSMSYGDKLKFYEGGKKQKIPLIANTHRSTREPNQPLSKHLTSVARYAGDFAGKLSFLRAELPALNDNQVLKRSRTPERLKKFIWQDSARDLGNSLSMSAETKGFFGINMASTGHGKTLGNVKIMAALNSERAKPRITIALGLRVLTLQTGEKLKEDLNLSEDEIATLVGGAGITALQKMNDEESHQAENSSSEDFLASIGSESQAEFIDGDVFGGYDTPLTEADFGVLLNDSKARKLLYTPIISTTIDHLVPATESLRGGRQIVPLLRLLTSDLILDEVDDFGTKDLYAVTRLIYLSGLLGSRIMLSSATLAPDLVIGLFNAYQAGYREWQKQHSLADDTGVICAWFDEFKQDHVVVQNESAFEKAHQSYITHRAMQLEGMRVTAPQRQGVIVPFTMPASTNPSKADYEAFAQSLLPAIKQMHEYHAEPVPASNSKNDQGKTVSTGILRIAHISNIIPLTKAFFELNINQDHAESYALHIVPYHARQLLLLRSVLEKRLDRILNRKNEEAIFNQPEIKRALEKSDAKHHIFMIIASPVIEVGRDIDVNWAISEPSSMGSLIQLCGRVLRHRADKIPIAPNIGVLNSSIRAKLTPDLIGYCNPGFEDADHRLVKNWADEHFKYLFRADEIAIIDSIPRIIKVSENTETPVGRSRRGRRASTAAPVLKVHYLSTLEHSVLHDLYFKGRNEGACYNDMNIFSASGSASHLYGDLQMRTRFRESHGEDRRYILFPVEEIKRRVIEIAELKFVTYASIEDYKTWFNMRVEDTYEQFVSSKEMDVIPVVDNEYVKPWLVPDVREEFDKVCRYFKNRSPRNNAIQFLTVSLDSKYQYDFNAWLGFSLRK
ncbi:type I-F CRISPR-associated helicase Cas3f [Ignatzschineria sp. RMDPL8A]|uniref:type I-F CRISPR-associated helicase Cas3f n=1 Tax=Ignatzschineria sp. RMDPL8A TaxID=2999236 RepID=UPI0024466242|nr:type I-F CRISPR-associated helicase Cas3f [Ignatzschineria sp. RMDPL8A]MDG9729735.1 type I-F CRISPR-associated helicase Cas3f [Ignatzschineria sp. RMDPL8A]